MAQQQTATPRKLRVLALHSWRTSGEIFRNQFKRAQLDRALEDLIDFVYVTAPNPASGPIPEDVAGAFQGPYYEWFTTEKAKDGQELVFTYHNMLESERFIMEQIRRLGPFDGICGFSQGGAMASAMVALQRAGLALQDVPPLKFVLFIGAVIITHPRYQPAFRERVIIPSCHIIGHKDYVKEHAIALARSFASPIVIMHNRGHIVPPLANEQLAVLRAFVTFMRDSPTSASVIVQQQRKAAEGSEPLEPPLPVWETEDEQVGGILARKQQQQQRGDQHEQQQQQGKLEGRNEVAGDRQQQKGEQQQQQQRPQQQRYVQYVKLSRPIPGGGQYAKL